MRHRGVRIALDVLFIITAAACAPQAGPDAGAAPVKVDATGLTGAEWRLQDLGGRAVIDDVPATLAFVDAGRVAGRASCNRFSGEVTVREDGIAFGALMTTRMACEAAIDDQERAYLTALQSAERFKIDGSKLSIFCKGMNRPLVFARMASQ